MRSDMQQPRAASPCHRPVRGANCALAFVHGSVFVPTHCSRTASVCGTGKSLAVSSFCTRARRPRFAPPGAPVQHSRRIPYRTQTTCVAEGSDDSESNRRSSDLTKTLAWVSVAAVTAGAFAYTEGQERALEFVAGYIVEYSLSVDNLFVFLLIFNFFKVPRESQDRVLGYGILGAMVMRGILIVFGAELTRRFEIVQLGFAAILLFSAFKLLTEDGDEDEDLEQNSIVKFSRRLLPFTDKYDGTNFFTMQDGVKMATPLMLVLLSVEFSDVVFALDSVPAVLGISQDTKVVYASNILAILGLRNLFFLLSGAIDGLRFLQPSLAIVLGFVGGKMIASVAGYHIDIVPSLAVVLGTLGGGVGLSLAFPGASEDEKQG